MDVLRGLSAFSVQLASFTLVFAFASCSDDDNDEGRASVISDDGYAVSGVVDGYYYVDLGLSVKWADRNVGALASYSYGNYYAWGETEVKDSYTKDNCSTGEVWMSDIAGNADYDAATANWGSRWRMPTEEEVEELVEKCSWEWTRRDTISGCRVDLNSNGSAGYLVTGPNGNSIFLPAAGHRYGTSYYDGGTDGRYWSSTPDISVDNYACSMHFYHYYLRMRITDRHCGRSVRAVLK